MECSPLFRHRLRDTKHVESVCVFRVEFWKTKIFALPQKLTRRSIVCEIQTAHLYRPFCGDTAEVWPIGVIRRTDFIFGASVTDLSGFSIPPGVVALPHRGSYACVRQRRVWWERSTFKCWHSYPLLGTKPDNCVSFVSDSL
jgi:hypothetical protein